jgi:hypothetical protein
MVMIIKIWTIKMAAMESRGVELKNGAGLVGFTDFT